MFLSHAFTSTSAVALVHAQVLIRPSLLHLDAIISAADYVDGVVNVSILLYHEGIVGLSFSVVHHLSRWCLALAQVVRGATGTGALR